MTIDRAIEILDPEHREWYDSIETVNEACRMGMEALKTLNDMWISCKDRLPESPGNYLVAMKDGDRYHVTTRKWANGGYWERQTGGIRFWNYLPPPPPPPKDWWNL
ncbi:MAG: DUF551 domain-containing protein [Oscillospiraceae bacterium]|nr:DUF551 domain-containing protein [Oscillospiraceae bacterium]